MPKNTYSLLGPMNDRPYAIGERPGGNYIPSIPLLSGKEAWDSLSGKYRTDMLPYRDGGARKTDDSEEKKACGSLSLRTLAKLAVAPGLPTPPVPPPVTPAAPGGAAPRPFEPPAAPPPAAPQPQPQFAPVPKTPGPPISIAWGDKPAVPQLNQGQGYWDAPAVPQDLHGAYEARQQGLLPEDVMRGKLPALRSTATPAQQGAHTAYSQQFDDYMANRKLWEDRWAGQGDEGAQAYHKAFQDFAGKSVPSYLQGKTVDDKTLAGLGYKGRPAQHSGGILGFGQTETAPAVTPQQEFDETKATRDKFFKERGASKWDRSKEYAQMFGDVPEEQLKAYVASGKAPPRVGEMYDAFKMMDTGLGRFGAGADTGNAMHIPGAALLAQSSGGGVKNLADPEMQARWQGSGKIMGNESPVQRIRELTGQSQFAKERAGDAATQAHNQQGFREALPLNDLTTAPMRLGMEYANFASGNKGIPVNELFGATTAHLNPDEMYQRYKADGLPDDVAIQKALQDRKNLTDTRGTPERMLGAVPKMISGAGRTMGSVVTAPSMLYGEATAPKAEQGERARGWARDLAGIVADPFEAATGFEVGNENGVASRSRDSYMANFQRQGGAMGAAARDPKQFGEQLAQEKATLADQQQAIKAEPGSLEAMLADSKTNPEMAAGLQEHAQMAGRARTGETGANQALAEEYANASPGKELGGRMLGSGMAAVPAVSQLLSGGSVVGGGAGKLMNSVGAFSAAAPGFEAMQTGLDHTPVPGADATVGQYQQAAGQRIREVMPQDGLGGIAGEAMASGVESLPSAATLIGGGKGLGKIPGLGGAGAAASQFGRSMATMGPAGGALNKALGGATPPQPSAAADLQRRMGRPLYGWEKSVFGDVPKQTTETLAGTSPPPQPNNPNMGTAPKDQPQLGESASKFVNPQALAKADPEVREKAISGVNVAEKQFGDDKQKALGQKAFTELASDKLTQAGKTALGNLKDQTGWSWDQTQKAYGEMDQGSKFLMWAGLGLGTVSALSSLMGDGDGMLGWITSLLGLAVAGGAAAHGGLLGEGAQKGMQGMMTQFDAGRRHLSGESPEQIAKAYNPQQMAENVLPMAVQFGAISPEQQKQLDAAIAAKGGWGEWASGLVGGPTAAKGLEAAGIKDPAAQKNLLEGWRLYRKQNLKS